MMKKIKVADAILALCPVKNDDARDLTRDETRALTNWCDVQRESLWDGMTLQEILNVYRASAVYDTFEGMEESDNAAAIKAWNSAVISPNNRLVPAR